MSVEQRAPSQVPVPEQVSRQRFTSLDWSRGWMLVGLLATVAILPPRPTWLQHPAWSGVSVNDLIFPLFVGLSGVGMAFAYARRVSGWVTLRRFCVLVVVGILYEAVLARTTDLSQVRVFGPLQVYGVLTVVVALLHLRVRRLRAWIALTLGLAAAWSVVFWAFDRSCPTGRSTRSCNLSAAIDLRLVPAQNLYADGAAGHDPEGFVTMVGCLITMLVGVVAGKILLQRAGVVQTLARLATWALVVAASGMVVSTYVEPFKRLWTPSFALLTGVVAVTLLTIGYAVHDVPASGWWGRIRRGAAQPLVALGRNSLLVYFGSHLMVNLIHTTGDPSLARLLRSFDWPWGHPRATFWLAFIVFWSVLAALLHRRRLYLHA
jgi:predicted acyltransferase